METASSMGGHVSGEDGGGVCCMMPGSNKLAGDTLCEALMPLHPAPSHAAASASSASRSRDPSRFIRHILRANDMMATTNSGKLNTACPRWFQCLIALFTLFLATCAARPASDDATVFATHRPRLQRVLDQAESRAKQDTNSAVVAWELARACFDLADIAPDNKTRAALSERGIAAGRHAVRLDPKSAAAHYYLGMNLGQLARTKLLGALHLINEMEAEWKTAAALDPKFDHAGIHRSLGILYRDAPGWPTSVGNRKQARLHLQKAVELCPDYPENRLAQLEAWIKWGDRKTAAAQMPVVEKLLSDARPRFSGEAWALSWHDWDQRWGKIKNRQTVGAARNPRVAQ
jgi:tetratricopeptide (TPR) repeat protein